MYRYLLRYSIAWSHLRSTGAPHASMGSCCSDLPEPTHISDMGLSCGYDGVVDWHRSLPSNAFEAFVKQQLLGAFRCSICDADASSVPHCAGYVYCHRDDGEWEERHIMNMIGDQGQLLRCLRCHWASVPCKYFCQGFCARGDGCAYSHG